MCMSVNMKIAITFCHFEKNQEYIDNTLFFIKNGIIEDENIDYIFVCNGVNTVNFPVKNNIKVIQRKNVGYDFGAYGESVKYLLDSKKEYDYYIFINNSCRGPFIPPYAKKYFKWTSAFTDLCKYNVRLSGCTINTYHSNPNNSHVQTYAFCLHKEAFNYLNKLNFFNDKIYLNNFELIDEKEVGLSVLLKNNGWNISCLIPELQKINYLDLNKVINPTASMFNGDLCYPGNVCFGRELHPYEVLFLKENRGIAKNTILSLSK